MNGTSFVTLDLQLFGEGGCDHGKAQADQSNSFICTACVTQSDGAKPVKPPPKTGMILFGTFSVRALYGACVLRFLSGFAVGVGGGSTF